MLKPALLARPSASHSCWWLVGQKISLTCFPKWEAERLRLFPKILGGGHGVTSDTLERGSFFNWKLGEEAREGGSGGGFYWFPLCCGCINIHHVFNFLLGCVQVINTRRHLYCRSIWWREEALLDCFRRNKEKEINKTRGRIVVHFKTGWSANQEFSVESLHFLQSFFFCSTGRRRQVRRKDQKSQEQEGKMSNQRKWCSTFILSTGSFYLVRWCFSRGFYFTCVRLTHRRWELSCQPDQCVQALFYRPSVSDSNT